MNRSDIKIKLVLLMKTCGVADVTPSEDEFYPGDSVLQAVCKTQRLLNRYVIGSIIWWMSNVLI